MEVFKEIRLKAFLKRLRIIYIYIYIYMGVKLIRDRGIFISVYFLIVLN